MDLTLEEFSLLASRHLLMVAETQVEALYFGIIDYEKAKDGKTHNFIATYCDAHKARYGTNPLMGRKEAGQAKNIVKSYGAARACELIQTYLQMNDQRFLTMQHDLGTFQLHAQKVHAFHETGKSTTQTEARRIEQRQTNANAFKSIIQKRGGDG